MSSSASTVINVSDTDQYSPKIKPGFPPIEIPMKVEPGPRALEVRIQAIENLPRLAWSHTRHFFVQFKPSLSAPSQKPYGNKRATSVKKVGDAWGEQMLICIENESQPADITFQVMAWRRLHHHALFGEVSISQAEMTALMAQALGFELSVCLPAGSPKWKVHP